ncbi:hypothetical protein CTAYLR_005895 [Chrysophaeum taylorii]|uniref:Uncharacterized protein n=1 Tax=Chrysophaeum taylorii TaxID=2483200 RepID=A0AAD7XMI2_9STRA|nr:hypothetical protein CTAYLR_005868 [Chrysophaeum taylorii]KAJ8614313.1 hypothetical protein CTAYLR_005895 [Chrysophaeum taylorii]
MHSGPMSPEARRRKQTLLPAEHHRSTARGPSAGGIGGGPTNAAAAGGAAAHHQHILPTHLASTQQQLALGSPHASSASPAGGECRPEAPCLKCRQACTCSWCEDQGNTCTNRQSCSMRGKQCATCNASECRGKRAKRLRAHLGITEVRRPGYSAASTSTYLGSVRSPYATTDPACATSSSSAAAAAQQSMAAPAVPPSQAAPSAAAGHHHHHHHHHNWGARAVFGDHKYPTIRTGAPSTRVQMDALMHKCTMAATTGRQWQRVSTRDPQSGSYACRDDNNNNIRLELSGSVLGKLSGFVVVASVAAELGLDKIPDTTSIQGAVVLTAGHNVDVEPWGAPDHHKALLLITVAGDTVVAVAKTDGTAHQHHPHQHPLPNLFRTNPAQSNCVFQLFYASRGDLVYVPPGASYQTRHIGNDHILLVVKIEPLSFTSLDANRPLSVVPPVSYLAYPLGGAANHISNDPLRRQGLAQHQHQPAPAPSGGPGI